MYFKILKVFKYTITDVYVVIVHLEIDLFMCLHHFFLNWIITSTSEVDVMFNKTKYFSINYPNTRIIKRIRVKNCFVHNKKKTIKTSAGMYKYWNIAWWILLSTS